MMLFDMWPCLFIYNLFNCRCSYAVSTRQNERANTLQSLLSDDSHIIGCQLLCMEYCTALLCHISHIIGMCTKEQMIRAYTSRGITTMQYLSVFRNWAVVKLPRIAMRLEILALNMDLPIFSGGTLRPQPARISFMDSQPELISGRLSAACVKARRGVCGAWLATAFTVGLAYNSHVGSPFSAIGHASGWCKQRGGFAMPSLYHVLPHSGAVNVP